MNQHLSKIFLIILFSVSALLFSPRQASAHCDTLDGPVITAARKALSTNNVNYVLIWVKPENEDEIKKALKRAKSKRNQAKTKEEKAQADLEFFETLVKIHREGEGAKYEGIKPAGSVEPEIALADKAVKTGTLDEVLHLIPSEENQDIILHLFHKLIEKSHYEVDNVPAGREFIEAYVVFVHSVEKALQGIALHKNELHHH
ncbi:hypothetical protein A2209_01415 [Candidatus Roizmanbacteria bacterium RIFOXYA1_FULL_41_12]|uniref:Uncharacterized protein n=1 Tax=Candidatus Roizmanbacteria bacterium RIFOXYA1_FULL_41_12 TaxID=1802082 RepID=A0A1F7KGT4_9BACT|nr:MAG: hypothetical protein A2209_01415 [Candidatus Roizmanbacteria bacterium RIFOXYA1_FULL_41_12]